MRALAILGILAAILAGAEQEYRLRVTVNLIQLDATVTDASGRPVPGLTGDDFRVLLDGKPQRVTYCTYIQPSGPSVSAERTEPLPVSAARPPMPLDSRQHAPVGRAIALYIADLLTSSESIPAIRGGLRKFVNEQMRPGDSVAILRSSAGEGALQEFTSDRHLLLDAIDAIRWSPSAAGIGGSTAYEQLGKPAVGGIHAANLDQEATRRTIERATLSTIDSLRKVVRGMTQRPGRKSLVILSDGLRLTSPDEVSPTGEREAGSGAFVGPIYLSMRNLADESVRAGVVIYAIDTRGTASLTAGAADHLELSAGASGATPPPAWVWEQTQSRRDDYREQQWGSNYLASLTGGFAITEANRIEAGLERVMADQSGYYLLAFQPPSEVVSADSGGEPIYHRLKVSVTRPKLAVRSHSGFFGRTETPERLPIHLDVDAAPLAEKKGNLIYVAVRIDGKDLAFAGPPTHRTAMVHLTVRVYNPLGDVLSGGIDQLRRIDVDEEGYRRAREYGLIYTTALEAPKPGAYEIRVTCRDEANTNSGASAQSVAIPQVKTNESRISAIVLPHNVGTGEHVLPAERPAAYKAGQKVPFTFQVEGGAAARGSFRVRLYQDGQEVWKGELSRFSTNRYRLARGIVSLPDQLPAGLYLLRLELASESSPEPPVAWQWARLKIE
jgi:VWFA-related protein